MLDLSKLLYSSIDDEYPVQLEFCFNKNLMDKESIGSFLVEEGWDYAGHYGPVDIYSENIIVIFHVDIYSMHDYALSMFVGDGKNSTTVFYGYYTDLNSWLNIMPDDVVEKVKEITRSEKAERATCKN